MSRYTTEVLSGRMGTHVVRGRGPDEGAVAVARSLWDTDNDTGIQVEETTDDDVIRFDVGGATPIGDVLKISQANGFVWNDSGAAVDFRIESDTATHLFYIDGTNNAVGFNTDEPTFVRAGTTKATVFGVVKDDNSTSQNGYFGLASNEKTRSSDVSFLKSTGTWAAKTALSNNDVIANLGFEGHDGDDFIRPAMIRAVVDGAVSANTLPVEMIFLTGTTDGGGSNRIRCRSNGLVNFGGNRTSPEISFNSDTGAATFNEQGNNADFRVESQGQTHMFFLDADANAVGINDSTPLSTHSVNGSIGRAITRKTTTATIDGTAYQWNGDTDSAGFTISLPAGVQGREYKIVNVGTSGNLLTIAPNGSENLLGANSNFILNDGESLIIAYDATDGWY